MIYVLHNENAGMFINKCLPSVNVLLTQLEPGTSRRPDMKIFAISFNTQTNSQVLGNRSVSK